MKYSCVSERIRGRHFKSLFDKLHKDKSPPEVNLHGAKEFYFLEYCAYI